MYECFSYIYMYIMCMPRAHGGPKGVLGPLKQKLHMVVSHLVGAGNQVFLTTKSSP